MTEKGKKKRLTAAQRERLIAALEEDDEQNADTEHDTDTADVEETTSVNQVVLFNGSADDFFKHFAPASRPDATVVDTSDAETSKDDEEAEEKPQDEPQPKSSRSRYFGK